MAEETSNKPAMEPEEIGLRTSVEESRAAWRRLGLQLQSTTPADIVRYLLIGGVLAILGWLLAYAWPALIPFAIGAGLAYAVLPLVNTLDRVMPRRMAALLAMLLAVGMLLLAIAAVLPLLIEQFLQFAAVAPTIEEIRQYIDRLQPLLEQLPVSLQESVSNSLNQASRILIRRLDSVTATLPELLASRLLQLVNVLGAALGLLVLPTWLLLVLADQRKGTQALNRLLPAALQSDFWAVARIADRAFRNFLQNQVTQGLVAFGLTYLITVGLDTGGYLDVEYPLVVSIFVGLMELVPEIGPLVAVLVLAIGGLLESPSSALVAIVLYLVVHRLAAAYVGTRVRHQTRELHPAVMLIGAVALSELGLFWFLFSVPLLTTIRDLLAYLHGRLSSPPRPAGLLPGEEARAEGSYPAPSRIPLVYRRAATERER